MQRLTVKYRGLISGHQKDLTNSGLSVSSQKVNGHYSCVVQLMCPLRHRRRQNICGQPSKIPWLRTGAIVIKADDRTKLILTALTMSSLRKVTPRRGVPRGTLAALAAGLPITVLAISWIVAAEADRALSMPPCWPDGRGRCSHRRWRREHEPVRVPLLSNALRCAIGSGYNARPHHSRPCYVSAYRSLWRDQWNDRDSRESCQGLRHFPASRVSAMIAAALFLKRDRSGTVAIAGLAADGARLRPWAESSAPTGNAGGRRPVEHASPQSSLGPIPLWSSGCGFERLWRRSPGSPMPVCSPSVSLPATDLRVPP